MKVAAPPYSPPVENPWIIRSAISSAGAQKPMLSYEGIRPTQKVAPAISNMVKASTDLRPMRSPSGPQNSPPSGRMRKEMAKVRSEEHTSELQSLIRISYAVFCLKKKPQNRKST